MGLLGRGSHERGPHQHLHPSILTQGALCTLAPIEYEIIKESRWIGVAPQEGDGVGEEVTKGTKGWGCTRGGLGEGGKRGRERAAAEEPIPKSQGKTPRGAVQVLLTAWARSGTVGGFTGTTVRAPLGA